MTKEWADRVFKQFGLTASQAIALFYKHMELQRGLPFPTALPSEATKKALDEARDRENLPRFETTEDSIWGSR